MKTIGILGGGQLALMMLPYIKELGHKSVILDQKDAPCAELADEFIEGDFSNEEDCLKLSHCDVITFEIENISLEGLKKLAQDRSAHPAPTVLSTIQNKGTQKQFLKSLDVPTSNFEVLNLDEGVDVTGKVVKLCTGGYDGKGVWVPSSDKIPETFMNQDCVVEDRVHIEKELAQVCTRSVNGEIVFYEMVEMVMDEKLNLLDYQINPAQIDSQLYKDAQEMAKKIADGLNYVGTLAIEFFLDHAGKLWVNELAPRVHNSGHNTIESAPCSQFENHIRAITGMPLGNTMPAKPSLTMNLIGSGESGATHISMPESLEDVYVHLYNKKISRPGRKMGHVTLLGDKESLVDRKDQIKELIKITGKTL